MQPFASRFSLLRRLRQFTRNLKSTCNLTRLIFCGALLSFATAAFAATTVTVTVLSPKAGAGSGSPIFYEAYATSPTCANGISAMRIYSAPGVSAYTVDGAHIETFIPLSAGTYSTVVEAWDNCGGVGTKTVDIKVNSDAGVSVFLPKGSSAGIPVHIAASAQNPGCPAGISAIRIYTGDNIAPYTIDSNQVNTFVNLLPGKYDLTVQAWDNCGNVYKAPRTETATATADGYLYAVNSTNIAEFDVSSGILKNPNGSGNPPLFAAANLGLSIGVDPGGWFAWVFTTSGIYGYQIDQTNGNLWAMPGSPFPLNGTPTSEPSGYLYPDANALAVDPNGNFIFVLYQVSNTVVAYRVNRSTGALTPAATVTGYGGMDAVTVDFTGQYMYADNNESNNQATDTASLFGYQINQNNGALTAVPGSPYELANAYGGGSLSSTMLASGSPGSPLLYAGTGGPNGYFWGFTIDYGTGALTGVAGSPFYDDGGGGALADNLGKWVWSGASFPTYPPQALVDYGSIEAGGTLSPSTVETLPGYYLYYGWVEDGSGKYIYMGGSECESSSECSTAYPSVNSFTVGSDGALTALSGPLQTDSANGMVMAVGAAPKHGD